MEIKKCTICGIESKALHLHMRKHSFDKSKDMIENTTATNATNREPKIDDANSQLLAKIDELEKKDKENQDKLKMLIEIADKGRLFNYQSSRSEKKPFIVKLSVFQEKIIIGWRTLKDELVKHPTSGLTVGEVQQYELLLLDKDGVKTNVIVNGYPSFSEARYGNRIEAEVIVKKEDWQGNYTFEVKLPDGRVISLDSRFVN